MTTPARQHRRMNIVSWNVNSLNVRLPHVLDYLRRHAPDVLALQETKVPDEKFPRAALEEAGWHVCFSGQKTYNGVAIVSREPVREVVRDWPDFDDPQRRLLAVTVGDVRIINVYVPNGQEVDSEKYRYKFRWLDALEALLRREMAAHDRLVVLGDFNITPTDADVHDPARWRGKIMCSEAERARFRRLLDMGLCDTVRAVHPDEPCFTWWDYRLNAFRRGWGLRIDHVLATPALAPRAARVDEEERAAERPSDHAPVRVDLA